MRFPSYSDYRFSSVAEEKEKGSDQVDHFEDAGQAVANTEASNQESRKLEKRIVRKLDMTLLPTVWTLYLFKSVQSC